MLRRSWLWGVLLGCFVAWSPIESAQLYYYIDQQGEITSSNQWTKVPEPFATAYQAIEKHAMSHRQGTPSPMPPTPYGLGAPVLQLIQERATFQALLLAWRRQLITLLHQLVSEHAIYAEMQQNPTLAQIPPLRGDIEQQRMKIKQMEEQLQHALQMLTVQLPKQARQQGIPPAWFGP